MARQMGGAMVMGLLAGLGGLSVSRPARAEVNDWFTAGLGARYGFGAAGDADAQQPAYQYGLVTRVKVLRFLGLELSHQLDDDPATQAQRALSPRHSLSLLLNLVPTDHFNLFVSAGFGAQNLGDLLDLNGRTTSLQAGPGLEVYLSDHVALGADVRWRVPGPNHLKREMLDTFSADPLDDLFRAEDWQLSLSVSYYL